MNIVFITYFFVEFIFYEIPFNDICINLSRMSVLWIYMTFKYMFICYNLINI